MRSLAGLCMNNEVRPRKDHRGVDLISDASGYLSTER